MADDPQALRAMFDRFDTNQDGTIDETEFVDLLRALQLDITRAEATTAFLSIDVTSNQRIEFGEFAEWWASLQ